MTGSSTQGAKTLLHPVSDAMVVVLGLDNRQGEVRFVVEDVVRKLRFAASHELAANDDPPLCQVNVLADLDLHVPPRLGNGRGDELRADVSLGEGLFV